MAKSYKKDTLALLANYPTVKITVNNKEIDVYSYSLNETLALGLGAIIAKEGLSGKTFPVAIVQYNTFIPWTNNVGPMIAFIWSWGGPWALHIMFSFLIVLKVVQYL